MDEKKRSEFNNRTMFFTYYDKDGEIVSLVGPKRGGDSELETTTGEGILVIAFTVAILAGCGILSVLIWASQQPIY